MFRTAELGQKIPKKEYNKLEIILRQELLELQHQLLQMAKTSVLVVFAGVDGGGKGATVNLLNTWLDARWLRNHAYRQPSDEEKERPEYWRYWRDIPPKGQIGLFLSSWYSRPVLDRAYGSISIPELDEQLERVVAFENALADDGALILKFWMHLSRDAQKARFKSLEKDPLLRWQVTDRDWEHWRLYDNFVAAAERTIMRTNTGKSAWTIVEGVDPCHRSVVVGTLLRDALQKTINVNGDNAAKNSEDRSEIKETEIIRLTSPDSVTDAVKDDNDNIETVAQLNILSSLDMSLSLEKKEYKKKLVKYQARLNLLHQKAMEQGVSTMVLFEGPDAAGKGSAIRRVISAMDAHNYQVLPFAAPTDEERARHYLWRFWRYLSRAGHVTIFDRSWYGRVLVERVEGFATEAEWRRAYAEINDFEDQLIQHGIVLVKFWIQITKDEQLQRFNQRKNTPYKQWKLTEEDWRNREKWEDYEAAVHDMVQYTSTSYAPWILVEGNDKPYARIKVLKTLCTAMEAKLT